MKNNYVTNYAYYAMLGCSLLKHTIEEARIGKVAKKEYMEKKCKSPDAYTSLRRRIAYGEQAEAYLNSKHLDYLICMFYLNISPDYIRRKASKLGKLQNKMSCWI